MISSNLETEWAAIEPPSAAGDLAGRQPPGENDPEGVLIAVDHHGLRHLLIAADPDAKLPKQPTSKGLRVALDELRVGQRPPRRYYDIACRDRSATENFTAVAGEILEALPRGRSTTAQTIQAVIDRWRWFWSAPPEALNAEQQIGLFGELWFLEFWMNPIDSPLLEAWTGPFGDRHDLKWPAASVEIKATRTRADGAAAHRIASLDQLEDPASGQLYLFSLRATPDPIGAHTLNRSIDRIQNALSASPELVQKFDERLGLLGYSPAHQQHYDTSLRVTAEELYTVAEGFPRLTQESFSDGIPPGIDNVAYTLNLAACADWRIATAPGPESTKLRNTLE